MRYGLGHIGLGTSSPIPGLKRIELASMPCLIMLATAQRSLFSHAGDCMEALMLGEKPFVRTLVVRTTSGLLLVACCASGALAQLGSGGMGGPSGPPGPKKASRRYTPPQFQPAGPTVPVAKVRLTGQLSVPESRIRSKLKTREGRPFDPQQAQSDVRTLLGTGLFHDVKTYREDSDQGVIVTFELFPRPTIEYIRFEGNKVREKTLLKKAEIKQGEPLNRYKVEEAQRKLEEFYQERGNGHVAVEIVEGTRSGDHGVVFAIDEGPRQRIFRTRFEGNSIASDARLKTQIQSKPGIMWVFKGQVDRQQIDEDIDRLTAYYRRLGYFRAKIRPELKFDEDEEWLTLTFAIDEGPRYVVRGISVVGNQVFGSDDLMQRLELQRGEFFDLDKMNKDVGELRDIYGSQGYIFADVQAEPRFLPEPGELDLVYDIQEGKQYRVGNIVVNIDGDHPHTKHSVIRNRISVKPGDVIDVRELRASERRIKASQLFETDPMRGPTIAVRPRDADTGTLARGESDQAPY